jgi:hypothetical protein
VSSGVSICPLNFILTKCVYFQLFVTLFVLPVSLDCPFLTKCVYFQLFVTLFVLPVSLDCPLNFILTKCLYLLFLYVFDFCYYHINIFYFIIFRTTLEMTRGLNKNIFVIKIYNDKSYMQLKLIISYQ